MGEGTKETNPVCIYVEHLILIVVAQYVNMKDLITTFKHMTW